MKDDTLLTVEQAARLNVEFWLVALDRFSKHFKDKGEVMPPFIRQIEKIYWYQLELPL